MELFFTMIGPDILGLVILAVAGYLTWTDGLLDSWKRSSLKGLVLLVAAITILEIATVFFQQNLQLNYVLIKKVINMIGFSIMPIVGVGIAFVCGDKKISQSWKYLIPLWIWFLLCVASMWNGWIFEITRDGNYQRGFLFFLSLPFSIYGGLLFLYFAKRSILKYEQSDRRFLYLMFGIGVGGSLIQVPFPNMLFIWPCLSLVMLLYYFFLRQRRFQFDQLTNVRERKSFMEHMKLYGQQSPTTIFMFDINHLKKVNDQYGHSEGDQYILTVIRIIKQCLEKSGTIYRIGGDEFGVLCTGSTVKDLQGVIDCLGKENKKTHTHEAAEYPTPMMAYGYSDFKGEEEDSLEKCLKRADTDMYEMKAQRKMKREKKDEGTLHF